MGRLGGVVLGAGRRGINSEVVDLGLLGTVVLGSGRSSVNGEVVDFSLLGGVVLGARGSGVNSKVVDFSLLRGVVLRSGRSSVNGEVVDLSGLLVVLRVRGASFNSEVVDLSLLGGVVLGSGTAFDGVVGDLEGVLCLVLRTRRRVYSGKGGAGAVALAVFSLSKVNGGGVVGMTVGVGLYVNVRSSVFGRRFRSSVLFADSKLLLLEFLDTGTGTAVTFFFTRNTDLFFAVPFFAGRNLFGGDGDRRVLTFPSGLWLLGFDLNLFVGFGDGLGVGFAFPICRGEDAEGDGDASLKVQVCDFCWRERTFSYNLPKLERKTRRILWLLFLETKVGDLKRIGRWRAKAFSRSFRQSLLFLRR